VTGSPGSDQPPDADAPDLPGFRTWRALYLFVLGWFVLVVAGLAAFMRFFS
jgi:hypothetical protein